MARGYAYTIELTEAEYKDAVFMCSRGYLGEITIHATVTEEYNDTVVLKFTEPDAWRVVDTIAEDEHAVWALTTPDTTLGRKFSAFIEEIV